MKQEFKVGDWVTQKSWHRYYEVTWTDGKSLTLLDEVTLQVGSYNLEYAEFIKKEEPVMKESNEVMRAVKNKIDPSKKYRKVGTHEPVRIICTDRVTQGGALSVVGLRKGADGLEAMEYVDHMGCDVLGQKAIEEIPKTDWSKVQVDTLIWVGNIPRHFASYDGEWVYYFEGGTTSQTAAEMKAYMVQTDALWCSLEKPID